MGHFLISLFLGHSFWVGDHLVTFLIDAASPRVAIERHDPTSCKVAQKGLRSLANSVSG